ncbi:MAG: hypothetical protein OJF60_002533 [Burkholderiaceae bacterium]|nr:MAG: hypothetical protein OJF60_002533 [Burkholderiaceae bacterium]
MAKADRTRGADKTTDGMGRRRRLELIPDQVSHDTVECLETLLRYARAGDVIGIAFAAALKRRAYVADTAGECSRNPTFARGMIAALDDRLSARVHHADPDGIR